MHLAGPAWVEEEGRLGLQVEAVQDGSWEYDYAGERFDPEHRWSPLPTVEAENDAAYPAPQHPGHVVLLASIARVLGSGAGLALLPLTGLLLAATAAWLMAAEFEPRAARPAFWLAAASPLVVNAYVVWAYTLVAALAGFALLTALRVLRRGLTVPSVVALVAILAGGALLGPEFVLFAPALLVIVIGILAWRRRWLHSLLAGALASAGVVAGVIVEPRWTQEITGADPGLDRFWADVSGGSVADRLESRAAGAWRFLFDGGNTSPDLERLVALALIAALASGVFLRLRGREGQFFGATLAVAGAGAGVLLVAVRMSDAPVLPMLGLFAAWPVALLGLATAPWRSTGTGERAVVAIVLVAVLVVVATLPAAGAEREWGGRVLAPVVVPLAAVVGVGLCRRLSERPWQQRAAVVVALVALAAYPAARGLQTVREFRASAAEVDAEIETVGVEAVAVDNPLLIRTPFFSWRLDDDVDWYVSYGRPDELLSDLADAGIDEVLLFPDPERETLDVAPYSEASSVESPVLEGRGIPAFIVRNLRGLDAG